MDKAGTIFKLMLYAIQYIYIYIYIYIFSLTYRNVEPKKNNIRKARKTRKTRNFKRIKRIAREKIETERIEILK